MEINFLQQLIKVLKCCGFLLISNSLLCIVNLYVCINQPELPNRATGSCKLGLEPLTFAFRN